MKPVTSGVPFDEKQVLDAIYGPSDDPRWHSVIGDMDLMEFELPHDYPFTNTDIILDYFEKINF